MMFMQISNFTPEGVQESLSTSVTGFFEAGAERVLYFSWAKFIMFIP